MGQRHYPPEISIFKKRSIYIWRIEMIGYPGILTRPRYAICMCKVPSSEEAVLVG